MRRSRNVSSKQTDKTKDRRCDRLRDLRERKLEETTRQAWTDRGRLNNSKDSRYLHNLSEYREVPKHKRSTRLSSSNSDCSTTFSSSCSGDGIDSTSELNDKSTTILSDTSTLNGKIKVFDCIDNALEQLKPVDGRCKCAVVCLTNLQVTTEKYFTFNIEHCLNIEDSGMKPKSKSPKQQSVGVTDSKLPRQKDSPVLTTYIKSDTMDLLDDKKTKSGDKIDSKGKIVATESPKLTKKLNQGKNETPKIPKIRHHGEGDSKTFNTEHTGSALVKIDISMTEGSSDAEAMPDLKEVNSVAKIQKPKSLDGSKSPIRRGRKPKSEASTPSTATDSNTGLKMIPDISVTPSKDSETVKKVAKGRKKLEKQDSVATDLVDGLDENKLSVKHISRNPSESPSPEKSKIDGPSKDSSPVKPRSLNSSISPQPLKSKSRNSSESPSPRRMQKTSLSKTSPKSKVTLDLIPKFDGEEDERSLNIRTSVDDAIDAVTNRVKEDLKNSPSKSPRKPRKSESPDKRVVKSPNGERKVSVDKKSPNSQGNDSCSSSGKKKHCSRSPSSSPKKGKLKSGVRDAVRELEFDSEITRVILEKSKLPFPSDFQYKYTSNICEARPLVLSELIDKVKVKAVIDPADELTALFGKLPEPDYESEKSLSPSSSDLVNVSTDSDKTVTEFDTLTGSIKVETGDTISNSLESDDKKKNERGETDKDDILSNITDEQPNHDNTQITEDKEDKQMLTEESKPSVERKPLTLKSKAEEATSAGDNLDISPVKTVSVFEMFGLKLKTKANEELKTNITDVKNSQKYSRTSEQDTEKKNKAEVKMETEDEDVMFVSETKVEDSVVISSDDESIENSGDKAGASSGKKRGEKRVKPKFTTVNNIVEPKPLEVLSRLEKANARKESAFVCKELDKLLVSHKHNVGGTPTSSGKDAGASKESPKALIKEELKRADPDFDEIDGHVFISFASEIAMKAHVSIEKKADWLTEAQFRKMAHLKQMKERQQDQGSKRVTDIKSTEEQKLNFRGIPMRMLKYQKILKQELEDILMGRQRKSAEKSALKTPQKTADITKIKGWKEKFQNAEELQEATGINISESGKVHWKTEERLVKNLDPEDLKDIGLDLKKKRRKLVNYSNKKRKDQDGDMNYEYDIDDLAITESDVYNEDDEKPVMEKIPYHVKYLSQHKYGARKLFVKKMKLDAEDERILQKLGTQKMRESRSEDKLPKKEKEILVLSKITHSMAVAAVSALDKKLLNKAKSLAKAADKKKNKKGGRTEKIDEKPEEAEPEEVEEEMLGEEDADTGKGVDEDVNDPDYVDENAVREGQTEDKTAIEPNENKTRTRRLSSVSKSRRKSGHSEEGSEIKGKQEVTENTCTEPGKYFTGSCTLSKEPKLGCRYGCICYLCKLSDSSEEKEAEFKPPCDKEYCRLGCICDSIETKTTDGHHCRKPGCMFECKCPPKQPKPDIPREKGRKKKGKGSKKKRRLSDKPSEETVTEETVTDGDDNAWEPPSKKKKGTSGGRFANLPKRETTYRVAKNLDAVSRKAMEVYVSSEMFTEQKVRRRRSDQNYEDFLSVSDLKDLQDNKASKSDGNSEPPDGKDAGVLEISDEDTGSEPSTDDPLSCARIRPYSGPYKQKREIMMLNKRKGGPGSRNTVKNVIDLVDSDKEDNSGKPEDKSSKSDVPSTSREPQSVTEKMGLTNKIAAESKDTDKDESKEPKTASKWKTQMVCLKAKKKPDEKSQQETSATTSAAATAAGEIKLLEIMSNCNWEIDRTNMLSKISHIISKESLGEGMSSQFISWGAYLLEFLPKADKPAVIPPELKCKLPNEMFSIRIKVTKDVSKDGKSDLEPVAEPSAAQETEGAQGSSAEMSDEDRKKNNLKLQKKLIDKIKFAERLRNLIIQEQQKGVTPSKFSVSREGIEKALKKYKTQLWKAYTGSSNFTLQQLKKALQAAKGGGDVSSTGSVPSTSALSAPISLSSAIPITSCDMMSAGTLTRLQNQGLTVLQPNHASSGHSFINLSNLQSSSTAVTAASPLGNIMVHSSLPSSSHCPVSGSSFVPLGTIGSGKAFNQVGVEKTSTPLVLANQSLKNAIDCTTVSVPATISADCFPHIPAENFPGHEKRKIITLQRVSPPLSNSQPLKLNAVKVNNQLNLVPVSSTESVPLKSSSNDQTASSVSILSAPANSMISATSSVTQDIIVNSTVPIGSATSTTTTVNSTVVTIPNVMTMGKNLAIPPGKIIFVNTNPSAGKSLINPSQYLGSVTLSANAKGAQSNPSSPQPIQFPHPLKNIANINTTSMGTIITPTGPRRVISHPNGTSTGIYPIRFENGAVNSGMHVAVPSPEMIGFPKVSSLPFTLVPAGTSVDNNNQKMVVVPITAPFPGGFVSVANSVTGRLPDVAGRTVPSPVFGVPQQGISAAPVVEIRTPINAVSGPPVTSVPTCKEIKTAPIGGFVDQTKEVSGFNNSFSEFVKLSSKFEVIHSSALTVNKTKPNADCESLINGVSKTTNSNASTKVSEVTTDAEKNSNSKNHDSAIVNMENSHTEKKTIVDKRNHVPIKVVEGEISPENKKMDANKAECVHISDSDDNGDLDSLASSTRSLSSLSETIKTDVQKLELNCDTKVENGLEKKQEVYRNFEEENEEIKGILGIGKSAGNEMANTSETVNGKHNEEKCSMENITQNHKKTSGSIEKKIENEITILDDTDDSCLIIDEDNDKNSLPAKNSTSLQIMDFKARKLIGKRKQSSPDLLDEIVEWSVKKMKSDDRSKVKSVSPVQRAPDAIQIEDSEDSDVDILSCEFPEGSQSSKSKLRKNDKKTTADDDLLVMKVNIGEFQPQPSTRTSPQIQSKHKHVREKFRRLELKNLFDYLEKVVFKYNTDMQKFPGVVPKHMILEEAKNLLKALKQKNDLLKECLDDGLQYQKSLQYKLKALTSSFLKAGVPKLVLKNFLVGVERSLSYAVPKRKKTEADKVTDEDSDSTLDFDPMTPALVRSRLYPVTPDPADPIFDSKAQVEFLVQGMETPNPRGDSHQPSVPELNRTAAHCVLEDGTIQIKQDTGDLQLIDKSSDTKIPATKKLKPILPKSLLKQQNPRIYKLNVIKPGNKNEKIKVQLVQSCSNEKVENTKDLLLSQSVNSQEDCADVVVHLGKETAGDRSSSDEDEVRSSTGDTLLDPDHDLMHFEHIADISQSGDVIHHAGEVINQSEPVL